jgi:hypothetical protein
VVADGEEMGTMSIRRLIVFSTLVAVVVVIVPAAALAGADGAGRGSEPHQAPKAIDRPLRGRSTGINTVNLQSGAATYESSGHLSHLGAVTNAGIQTISFIGNTIRFTGTGTTVASNGDELFATFSGTATVTSAAAATTVNTITGGTGRFAGATGTFRVTSVSKPISTVGPVETFATTSTTEGSISYQR